MRSEQGIEIMSARRQKTWGWPAVGVFTLGGIGAGYYIVSAIESMMRNGISSMSNPVLLGMLGVAIAAVGFIPLAAETGRPFRSPFVVMKVRTSWISREIMFFLIFASFAFLESLYPLAVVQLLALCTGACFIISQGYIVFKSRSIAAWNVSVMPLLFLMSGLAAGYGVLLFVASRGYIPVSTGLLSVGFLILGIRMAVWIAYLFGSRADAFVEATRQLRKPGRLTLYVSLSFALPLTLLCSILFSGEVNSKFVNVIVVIAGTVILISTFMEKVEVVRSVGILRAVFLK